MLKVISSGVKTNLRGLSVVNDNVIWVSGSNGIIGKTINAGKSWKWITVKGFEKTDFRDIEAFDASTAIIMGISEPAYILKTTDGGDSWKVVYENKTKGMFLDAMDFWGYQTGMVIGDPIDGHFFIARSLDNGNSWQQLDLEVRPVADSGEGCFAASGTNIRMLGKNEYIFVSGGITSRIFIGNKSIVLPIIQGMQTTGANSVSVYDYYKGNGGKKIIVIGGNFNNDSSIIDNCIYTHDAGRTWKKPIVPPHGYRSCVEYLEKKDIIACGLNGVDYTIDGGKTWKWISTQGFHVARIAKYGASVFLAGQNGKIGKLIWN